MRLLLAALIALCPLAPALADDSAAKPAGDVPLLHEEAAAAGLHQVYDGPWEFFVGGGGAALDCDGSGFPSVFLAGGKNRAKLFVNVSKSGGPLKFEERPLDIGADPTLLDNVIGAYPIDIDGDGHMDLFVLRVGKNLLLKGGPDCTFTLANKEWNFEGDSGWTTSFAAEWEKGQKFPTLAIGHYVDRNAPGSPWGTCEENSLYRPQPGDKPDYSARTPLVPGYCALDEAPAGGVAAKAMDQQKRDTAFAGAQIAPTQAAGLDGFRLAGFVLAGDGFNRFERADEGIDLRVIDRRIGDHAQPRPNRNGRADLDDGAANSAGRRCFDGTGDLARFDFRQFLADGDTAANRDQPSRDRSFFHRKPPAGHGYCGDGHAAFRPPAEMMLSTAASIFAGLGI